jgi:hypothetical protein
MVEFLGGRAGYGACERFQKMAKWSFMEREKDPAWRRRLVW